MKVVGFILAGMLFICATGGKRHCRISMNVVHGLSTSTQSEWMVDTVKFIYDKDGRVRETIDRSHGMRGMIYQSDTIILRCNNTDTADKFELNDKGDVILSRGGPEFTLDRSTGQYSITNKWSSNYCYYVYDKEGYLIRMCDTVPSVKYSFSHTYVWQNGNMIKDIYASNGDVKKVTETNFEYYPNLNRQVFSPEIEKRGKQNQNLIKRKFWEDEGSRNIFFSYEFNPDSTLHKVIEKQEEITYETYVYYDCQ